ncbi:hypothetical protein Achl_1082 [Pseudarthrobacter chlorophenolicus A6]|uniref:Uncharacterized protein n=1 Tax=Pseudarthrobacter chlorophenolicus (strain ATCC 700700 / DSM 12829 / CIP 107037 / JCM 12360 / KCTC 9906 / NCIMB 13794 / A6) TaxID=452863 RepID=B8HE41_PSECP|nr:hypothetical protein [Pseudarthrobacter chlorophenolicus]ACL39076.1 hypothetical protein Achl_1082 [Pseudarthrobacter chlorophenolicus A6]SDR04732.1 hypothetical protein SAMN04489738_4444 [Pseudarthrobacter chlorophenolicus]
MDQNPFVLPILLLGLICLLAIPTVLIGAIELAFFREQSTGQAAKHRKQYVNNVMKVVLTSAAATIAAIIFVEPDMWRDVWPEFPTYSPGVSLIAVAIAALVSYKLEVASEAPATIYDLQIDLRKSWQEEEILSKHSLALHNRWLEGFKVTDGGRSMMSSKRPLDPRFQAAIELTLEGNYRDATFRRLALLTNLRMVQAMILGHPWRMLWLLLPAVAAILSMAYLTTILVIDHRPATPGLIFLAVGFVVFGIILSIFNIWARSTARLRKYCDLKRREELCALMLSKLRVLAAPAQAVAGQPQKTRAGSLRRLFRAIW